MLNKRVRWRKFEMTTRFIFQFWRKNSKLSKLNFGQKLDFWIAFYAWKLNENSIKIEFLNKSVETKYRKIDVNVLHLSQGAFIRVISVPCWDYFSKVLFSDNYLSQRCFRTIKVYFAARYVLRIFTRYTKCFFFALFHGQLICHMVNLHEKFFGLAAKLFYRTSTCVQCVFGRLYQSTVFKAPKLILFLNERNFCK